MDPARASRRARTRNEGRVRALEQMRARAQRAARARGHGPARSQEAERSGAHGGRGRARDASPTASRPVIRDFSTVHPARRPDRHHRPQRLRQDHAAAPAARRARARAAARVAHGTELEVAYFDQLREQLDDSRRPCCDNIGDGADTCRHRRRAQARASATCRTSSSRPSARAPPVKAALGRRAQPPAAGPALHASRPTCWCSTSPPTTSTSRPSSCSRSCSSTTTAPCCWSATTAPSSTTW